MSIFQILLDNLSEPLLNFTFSIDRRIEQKTKSEEVQMDIVTTRILAWLIANSENGEHVDIALRAISGASIGLPKEPLRSLAAEDKVLRQLQRCVSGTWDEKLAVKPTTSPKVLSASLRALSLLVVLDNGYILERNTNCYLDDRWSRWQTPASRIPVIYVLYVLTIHTKRDHTHMSCLSYSYPRLSKYYPDTSGDHDTFVLNTSALMLAAHWILRQSRQAEDSSTATLHDAAAKFLLIIHKHNERHISLRPATLLALAGGCANYIFHVTLSGYHSDTVSQLVYALLRLFVATEKSSKMLRYTISACLACFTHAFPHRHHFQVSANWPNEGRLILSEGAASALRLFWNCMAQDAEKLPQSEAVETLTRFGVFGVLRFLAPTLAGVRDIRQCLDQLEFKPATGYIEGLPAELKWLDHEAQAALACLGSVGVGAPEKSESDLVSILQHFVEPIGFSTLQIEPEAVSNHIYRLCHARSEDLWCEGLRLLGLSVKDRTNFDEAELSNMASLGLVGYLFTVSTASDPLTSPQAMRRLWELIALTLASTLVTPYLRISALDSLLRRNELAEIEQLFANYRRLPRSIDDLQLERIWYGTLEPMISSGPVLEIDGGIIQVMIDHYATSPIGPTPSSENVPPGAGPRSEILKKWNYLSTLFKTRRARGRWANIRKKLRVIRSLSNGPAGE
ncbi:hypothetical protein FRC12_010907 [Ceratobasidium sp. 428]|nr:hypothetical protein FRC12_010907 [Ceratobasidium sp. 428]